MANRIPKQEQKEHRRYWLAVEGPDCDETTLHAMLLSRFITKKFEDKKDFLYAYKSFFQYKYHKNFFMDVSNLLRQGYFVLSNGGIIQATVESQELAEKILHVNDLEKNVALAARQMPGDGFLSSRLCSENPNLTILLSGRDYSPELNDVIGHYEEKAQTASNLIRVGRDGMTVKGIARKLQKIFYMNYW